MVVTKKVILDKYDLFGTEMPDGRLTEPSDGRVIRLRDAIALSEKLGRQLTPEEVEQFYV